MVEPESTARLIDAFINSLKPPVELVVGELKNYREVSDMKKKELLVVAFVFGKEYQEYIPIFLFSLYKHYPEYDAKVYIDRELGKEIQRSIELVPGYGKKYDIVIVNKINKELSSQQMKAYKWLLYDEVFEQYKYLYIGDIDVYICKESIPLHEQHVRHMNSQNLIYSNIVRAYGAPPKWIREHQNLLKKIKLDTLAVEIYNKFFYQKRLSGLHFINVDVYYKAIKKQRERFFKVYYDTDIVSRLYGFKMKLYTLYTNEALLYHIIKKSHLGLPIQCANNVDIHMYYNMESNYFRPYHGLHLGIWRNLKKADISFDMYLQTKLCQDYYAQFKDELAHDAVLKEMVANSPAKIRKIINTMIDDLDSRYGDYVL